MDRKKQISDYIDSHRSSIKADIAKLVAIRSVSDEAKPGAPFGEGCDRALKAALKLCASYGFDTHDYEGYVGTAGFGGKPGLDILGHLDVVGEGDGWQTDPYSVVEENGLLKGRGVADDKGPVVAAIYGMRAVRELGLPISKGIRLIMGTDEETGSRDISYFYSREEGAPNTFSPDADFPVYNVEKGGYRPFMTERWAPESALPRVSVFDGGFRLNVLPAKASAAVLGLSDDEISAIALPRARELGVELTVDNGALEVMGTAAHAASPEEGNNGLTALLDILSRLPLADCSSTSAIRALVDLFPHGDCHGTVLGIDQQDNISGRLTLTFSLLSIGAEGLEGRFDSRVPLCADDENCRFVAEKALGARGITATGEMSKGHHTPADTPFVQSLLQSYREFTGNEATCHSMGGGTYVHDIEGGVAFGAGMPGFDPNMHGVNERIKLDDLLTAAKIFAYAISDICK